MRRIMNQLRKQEFDPDALGLLVNPFYFARRGLRQAMAEFAPNLSGRLLDVGCGRKPYRALFTCDAYIGMDVRQAGHAHDTEPVDVFYDGRIFPFPDATFDGVVCNQVLEHVFQPDTFLGEISRVLKVHGCFLLTVPFVWDEHEQPWDYARYSSYGLKDLLRRNGFEILAYRKTMADLRTPVQLAGMYMFKATRRWRRTRTGALLASLLLNAPLNLFGAIFWRWLPFNQDLYLDSVVWARKRSAIRD